MVTLRKIDEDNFFPVMHLKVAEAQANFVAPNVWSVAQAWLAGERARPFAIYDDETLVGFFMASVDLEKNEYDVWRLMIDQQFQGKGYGRQALRLAIDYLKGEGAKEILLSYEPENETAGKLYASEGFVLTGEVDEGELVAKLVITD